MNKKIAESKLWWFFIGVVFIFFANGKWMFPAAIWIMLLSLLRFSVSNKSWKVFLSILLLSFFSNIFIFDGWLPLPSPLYYIVSFISAVFFAFPFFLNRLTVKNKSGFLQTLIFPSLLTIFSYLYSLINPSGTFLSLAYTQSNIYLLQIVSITGIWGIIFFIGWTAATINYLIDNYRSKKQFRFALTFYLSVTVVVLIYGIVRLNISDRNETIKIAGIVHEQKFNKSIKENIAEFINCSNNDADSLFVETINCAKKGARIIFWQEAAHLVLDRLEENLISRAEEISKNYKIYLGMPVFSLSDDFPYNQSENKIIWITPEGEIGMNYLKAYPTPAENIIRGDRQPKVITTPFGKMSSAICFDLNFPDYIKEIGRKGANILCVPANDWKEITPYHANISAFRAIENGMNIFRTTGNGLSVVYDCNGRILSSLNSFKSENKIIYASVPIRTLETIYPMVGDFLPWLAAIIFITITIINKKRVKNEHT